MLDTILHCMTGVGVFTVVALTIIGAITIIGGIGIALRTCGTKGQPALGQLKIPADCRTDPHTRDFIVDWEHPDGNVISVLIPIDSAYWKPASTRIGGREEPFGLNLVCPGHYT